MLVPCQACGESCKVFGNACSSCLCPPNKPSPIFVLFSCLMNGLILLFAVLGLLDSIPSEYDNVDINQDKPNQWLGGAAGIAALNIVFALYLYWKFSDMTGRGFGRASDPNSTVSPSKAAVQLCLYDVGVCIYLFFAVFMIIWTFLKGSFECDGSNWRHHPCSGKHDAMDNCQICLLVYMLLGVVVIFLSVCTECCRPPRYVQQVHVTTAHHQPMMTGYPPPQQQQQQQPVAYAAPPAPQQYTQPPAGYPPPQPYAPPPQQQPHQQPPQKRTAAEKAGSAVGGLLGKGLGAIKK